METGKDATIAILGLSSDPERYSYRANLALRRAGYARIVGVHPTLTNVAGTPVVPGLRDVERPVHTLTMYLSPARQTPILDEILELHPKRIIFNPGSENPDLVRRAREAGIETLEACTLVLLATQGF